MPALILSTTSLKQWRILGSFGKHPISKFELQAHFSAKISSSPLRFVRCTRCFLVHFTPPRPRACGEGLGPSSEDELNGAQEAISEILAEAGVSQQCSVQIASSSPTYAKMLIESVREMDEASLWKSWHLEGSDIGDLTFREKVIHMAKRKGDRGILPFLESLGLNPSSLMHVARYLSSESLLELMDRVKYLKELLYSGADQPAFISKSARRMMMHLSIFVDDDIQQTLSFFEKMEARRGGINMLDSKDASFPFLIESFPSLLLRSVEFNLKPLVEYLEGIGVPKERMRTILLLFPPVLFYDTDTDMRPMLHTIGKLGVKEKDTGRMLLKYAWILSRSIQGNYEKILSFFEEQKVPKTCVDRAIQSGPLLLGCSISKLKPMVQQFAELGIKNKKLGQVIASSPQLLLRKPKEFLEVVSYMEDLGFEVETVGQLLARCPEIFAADVDNTLQTKVKVLLEFGFTESCLPRVIRKYPELLVSDVQNTLLPRLRYLMKSGLSKRQVVSMVRRFSPILGYSIEEVLKPKLDFLVNSMNMPIRNVVDYPRYFSYSLEKKIMPRFWVLKGRRVNCSLEEMLGKNDEDFASEYMGIVRMLVPPEH